MKKFIFKLEAVLTDRKRTEDMRLKEWSIVNRMLAELKGQQVSLETRLKDALVEATEFASAPTVSPAILAETERFIQGVKQRLQWKVNDITRAEKFVEQRRSAWFAARQKRMIIDKIKEKRMSEHRQEARDQEYREQDDQMVMRARLALEEDHNGS
jgi:flagellar FliJ protein